MAEFVDLSPQMEALKKKCSDERGNYWWRDEAYMIDCAALWGCGWPCPKVNDCGVFNEPWQILDVGGHRDWRLEIRGAQAPNGFWACGASHWVSNGGGGHAPSVFDAIAFKTWDDLKDHTLDAYYGRFKALMNESHTPENHRPKIKDFLDSIQSAKTPQLTLF